MVRQALKTLAPWVLFHVFLSWGWRVTNPFREIPGYGDVLESLWGFIWYERTIFRGEGNPFFTPLIAHPLGWHTTNLAHTPLLFFIGSLIHRAGGPAFAYNILALLSLYICFAGMFLFLRRFTGWTAAALGALVYTFVGFRWIRVGEGHLNIAWTTSLIPWMAWSLQRGFEREQERRKLWIFAGLLWGLMGSFSLYGILLGGLMVAGWLTTLRWRWTIILSSIALIISMPIAGLYLIFASQDGITALDIPYIAHWGISGNELVIPSVFHPIMPLQNLSRTIYRGFLDESGYWNLGIIPVLLGFLGVLSARASPTDRSTRPLIRWVLLGGLLALGPYLKWNGQIVNFSFPPIQMLHMALWKIGHQLKPDLFPTAELPHPAVAGWIPLPAIWLLIFVPFFEGWRVAARCLFVSAIGLFGLAAFAWERLPRSIRIPVAILWLIETLPAPTGRYPFPFASHPAYEWLAAQTLKPGEGIIELPLPAPSLSADLAILWSPLLHHKPDASISRPFLPRHIVYTVRAMAHYDLRDARVGFVLQTLRARYVLMHVVGDREKNMWERLSENSVVRPIRCFDPPPMPSPWAYPICVAELRSDLHRFSLAPISGWSGVEGWGMWAEGTESRSFWIATHQTDHLLRVEAFPYCVPGWRQQLIIFINQRLLSSYEWDRCEARELAIGIPSAFIRRGANELTFKYGYAVRPVEVTSGQNPDSRLLSVGFSRLEILALDSEH